MMTEAITVVFFHLVIGKSICILYMNGCSTAIVQEMDKDVIIIVMWIHVEFEVRPKGIYSGE